MKRWQMYHNIHSMKNMGFSKRQIASKLELDYRTVSKYLAMTPEEFNSSTLKKERQQNLGLYEGVVTDWLKKHPDMTAAQVYDWLKEHYQVTVAERTARRFVENVRKKHSIPKVKGNERQYMAVEDPPMGRQMQVDIGEIWVVDAYKRSRRKLYCVAAVMSHSRYKCGIWYTHALTATKFIQALQWCFEYMGGMPEELVFDQDRLLAVDENYGDIIYTKEFEQYRQASGFKVYLCRGGDPESKGRVEAVVKFFKGNYARNRQFADIDIWNEDFEDWLDRTGNAKEHGATKKIPAEAFMQERLFLKPVPSSAKAHEEIITRTVHKDNTIFHDGNRYTVPIGTYPHEQEVALGIEGDRLIISNLFGDYVIAEHTLSKNKGELVSNRNHRRETGTKLDSVQQSLAGRFDGCENAEMFLAQIRILKPRYARDQFALIGKTMEAHSLDTIGKALNYCVANSLYSAVEFRNAAEYFEGRMEAEKEQILHNPNVIYLNTAAAISKKRELTEYGQAAKGGAN
jgi:transposase